MTYTEFSQKSKRSDRSANDKVHFFSRYFSTPVAFIFYKLGFTPNGATFVFLLIGLLSSLSLFLALPIASYLFWRFHIILDMADGDLARATGIFSKSATGFDRSNHIVINTTFLLVSARDVDNILLVCFLLISFYLFYFFDRNYFTVKQKPRGFSRLTNMFKDVFSLEGYILLTCLFVSFELEEFQSLTIFFYSLNFFILYLYKLKLFFVESNT